MKDIKDIKAIEVIWGIKKLLDSGFKVIQLKNWEASKLVERDAEFCQEFDKMSSDIECHKRRIKELTLKVSQLQQAAKTATIKMQNTQNEYFQRTSNIGKLNYNNKGELE